MNIKSAFSECSEGEEHVTENWREVDHCYLVAEHIAKLRTQVSWKEELVNNNLHI
jgi:hypothetical protein